MSPPWNSSTIPAPLRIGSTAAISWVSGPITPETPPERSFWVAGTASARSHWVSCWLSLTWLPLTPPAALIAFCATWEPCSIAWPRLASRPLKHDSTP